MAPTVSKSMPSNSPRRLRGESPLGSGHRPRRDPHSPLHRIKTGSSNPSVGGMKRLLARLELIEATGVLEIDVGWVNGNYQRILFHSVRTASADRVREMAAPRRHLALVCFLHQAWRDTLDQAVDMYGKLLDRNRKLVEARLDDMLKAQRQAVDRIVHRYRQLGAVLLDPDVGDDELRVRLLSTVPEAQLREDQSDLANWTRGDRKARFEQTAERHAGLSQFAGPFLSRMKFVDEQGEGASPTLSALRAYREHRAAGRRGVPSHAPLDFAPAALQPLIRHDGVTERRRWLERVVPQGARRDPDRQPPHRRHEELRPVRGVLPAGARWEQVREAFWARTGFPVDPSSPCTLPRSESLVPGVQFQRAHSAPLGKPSHPATLLTLVRLFLLQIVPLFFLVLGPQRSPGSGIR